MPGTPFVLFVCLHGSAKSVIASEHFRRLASERGLAVDVASAGTEPDAALPDAVVQGLRRDGISADGLRPRAATRSDIDRASLVVAFGCDLAPLAPTATTIERWDDVPPVSEGYERARDVIVARVRGLVGAFAESQS